jgi:hypothetical protein
MKSKIILFAAICSLTACKQNADAQNLATVTETVRPLRTVNDPTVDQQKIQVALLLDTSNSMDGLIDQAKSRLWNIVNTLTTLKYNGKSPDVEIALYEYGNDNISNREDWVRQVVPLTKDLDDISEKLFALSTRGGTEYCGSAINHASKNLNWSKNDQSMKLLYIAGNEPFNQQGLNYKEAISEARKHGVYINTIHCGSYEDGVSQFWKDGADLGEGKYFNIDSDKKIIFIPTPYDDKLSQCNLKLNDTYINFSIQGASYKTKQINQDQMNESVSKANLVERTVSKSKAEAYDNSHWDMVDNYKKDKDFHKKIKKEDLPVELKGKSEIEIKAIAEQKLAEREKLQKEISELAIKRQKFIDVEMNKRSENTDDLGVAMEKSILEIGKKKGYKI